MPQREAERMAISKDLQAACDLLDDFNEERLPEPYCTELCELWAKLGDLIHRLEEAGL
jgi:hypothetical protein